MTLPTRGLCCPKCGGRRLPVRHTYPRADGLVKRYRKCRDCGHIITTVESKIGKGTRLAP